MKHQAWVYDIATGAFVSAISADCGDRDWRAILESQPPGLKAIEGSYDHLSQRVDVATGNVVDYQPPKPDDGHDWDTERKRWRKRADVIAAETRAIRARHRIKELELAQQRPMRELAIDPNNAEAKQRLEEIDGEIAGLRGELVR